jgi:ribosome-associated toxin RatA of RatAB toxin-antitoxin module
VPDQARSTITIDAPPDKVMAVIANFEAYPTWSTQVKRVDVLETDAQGRGVKARFVIDAGVLRDEYTLVYDWSVPDSVSWQLVTGNMQKSQEGSYTLRPYQDDATEVAYELTVELAIPMLGLFKRKAEKMIIDTALKGLKRHVEAG